MAIKPDDIEYYAEKIQDSPCLVEIAKKAGGAQNEQHYTFFRDIVIDALPFSSHDNQSWRIEIVDHIIQKDFPARKISLNAGDGHFELHLSVTGLYHQKQEEAIRAAVQEVLHPRHEEEKSPIGGFFELNLNKAGQVVISPSSSPSNTHGYILSYSSEVITLCFFLTANLRLFSMPSEGLVLMDGWGSEYDGKADVEFLSLKNRYPSRIRIRKR